MLGVGLKSFANALPPALVFDGNSIVQGQIASPLTLGFAGLTAAQFPGWTTADNGVSVDGPTIHEVDALSTQNTDPVWSASRPHNIVVMLEVTNTYTRGWDEGLTQANRIAKVKRDLTTYVTNRHAIGWKVVLLTVLPTALVVEADRQTINAWIRASSGADAIGDIGANSTMGSAGANTNPVLYTDPNPTTYGHSLLAPIVTAAVQSIAH